MTRVTRGSGEGKIACAELRIPIALGVPLAPEECESPSIETLAVHRATVTMLARYLAADIPWVWVLGHVPDSIEWWTTKVPLTRSRSLDCQVRGLVYDFQVPTAVFLNCAADLSQHGIHLVQSQQQMPTTLDLGRLSGENRRRVLKANGALLTIDLPHAGETAVVASFVPGYLARFSGS